MKKWVIYCSTCLVTNKSYVGISCEFETRKKKHIRNSKNPKSCYAFQHAINKYGSENFKWEILEEHDNLDDANDGEQFFIAYLSTLFPNGYNLTPGGHCGAILESTRERIREKLKIVGSFVGKKGKDHPNYGKKLTQEHKDKVSKAHSGAKGPGTKLKENEVREIYLSYLNGTSTSDLMKKFNIKRVAIVNILNKKCWKETTKDLPDIDMKERTRGEKWVLSKITEETALNILNDFKAKKDEIKNIKSFLAKKYNVSYGIVHNLITGRNWKHLPR